MPPTSHPLHRVSPTIKGGLVKLKPKAKFKQLQRKPAPTLGIGAPKPATKGAPVPNAKLKPDIIHSPQPASATVPAFSALQQPKQALQIGGVKVRDQGFGVLPEHGFVRLPTILQVYPVSRASWWAGVKAGTLPAGVLLSARVRAWAVEDIRRLIAEAKQATAA